MAVGDGRVGDVTQTFDLKVGETILYSKFGIGVTDLSVKGALHILIREDDVIGTMPRSGATADDVPHLKPAADRVLLKVPPRAGASLSPPMQPAPVRAGPHHAPCGAWLGVAAHGAHVSQCWLATAMHACTRQFAPYSLCAGRFLPTSDLVDGQCYAMFPALSIDRAGPDARAGQGRALPTTAGPVTDTP